MKKPPLLPEETLHRVLRMANFNGLSVLAVSGMLTLAVAASGDYVGVVIGLLVAASGAIELHGAGLLRAGESRGMRWLIASQPYLAVIVLAYCGLRLIDYDPSAIRRVMTEERREQIAALGYDQETFEHLYYGSIYAILGICTLIYQGAMTVYYSRRRRAVTQALAMEDEAPRFN